MGKVTNPNVLFSYKECSLIQMARIEDMNGTAGERKWRSVLFEGTGKGIVLPRQAWYQEPKNQVEVLRWWCWRGRGGVFGFHEILVPFSQL